MVGASSVDGGGTGNVGGTLDCPGCNPGASMDELGGIEPDCEFWRDASGVALFCAAGLSGAGSGSGASAGGAPPLAKGLRIERDAVSTRLGRAPFFSRGMISTL